MKIQPYLFFGGRCEEALAFYQKALGANLIRLMRFSESPDPLPEGMLSPGFEHKIMHAEIRIGESIIMLSDGCETAQSFDGFCLSISLQTEAEVDAAFNALAQEGTITMPLGKTFWSPRFGMLTDRFGIGWMIGQTTES